MRKKSTTVLAILVAGAFMFSCSGLDEVGQQDGSADSVVGPRSPDAAKPQTADASPTCIDTVLCIIGDHFDSALCKCVPNPDAAMPPPADAGPVCIDNVRCIMGYHFDTKLCSCVPNPDAAGGPPVDAGQICLGVVSCPIDRTFDMKLCMCVPNPDAAVPPPVDAGHVCVDNVLCIIGDHFDRTLCQCVPNQDAAVSPCAPDAGCPSRQVCRTSTPLNCPPGALCAPIPMCVAVDDGGSAGCSSTAECSGALPSFCMVCPGGGSGCAHFVCVSGKCQVAFCP